MELKKYTYKMFLTKWPIYVVILGRVECITNFDKNNFEEIVPGLWAGYAPKIDGYPFYGQEEFGGLFLDEYDKPGILQGLKNVGDLIIKNSPFKSDTLIIIEGIAYDLTSYQEEALPHAVMMWAAETMQFECPHVEVTFDKTKKHSQYVYNYNIDL